MEAPKAAFVAAFLFLVAGAAAHADPEAGRKKAAACVTCHGPDGNSASGEYPILAGQTARYIYLELKDFKEGKRTNDAGTMASLSKTLSDDDVVNLAQYLTTLEP